MDNKGLISLLDHLHRIANVLDKKGFVKEAGSIDFILDEFKLVKIAQMQRSGPSMMEGTYEMEDELATPPRIRPGEYPEANRLQPNDGHTTPQKGCSTCPKSQVPKLSDPVYNTQPYGQDLAGQYQMKQGPGGIEFIDPSTGQYRPMTSYKMDDPKDQARMERETAQQFQVTSTPEFQQAYQGWLSGDDSVQPNMNAPRGTVERALYERVGDPLRDEYMNAPKKVKIDEIDPRTGKLKSQHPDNVVLAKTPGQGWLGGWNQELLDKAQSGQLTPDEIRSINSGDNLDPETLALRKKQESFWYAGQGTSSETKAMNERAFLISKGIDPATDYDFQTRMSILARSVQQAGNDPSFLEEYGWVPGADKSLSPPGFSGQGTQVKPSISQVTPADQQKKETIYNKVQGYGTASGVNLKPNPNESLASYIKRTTEGEKDIWERWYAEDQLLKGLENEADYRARVNKREAVLDAVPGRKEAWSQWWKGVKRTEPKLMKDEYQTVKNEAYNDWTEAGKPGDFVTFLRKNYFGEKEQTNKPKRKRKE